MSGSHGDLIFYLVCLVLPVSALVARRMPIALLFKQLAAWVAVFAIGLLALGNRDRAAPLWARVTAVLHLDDQQIVGHEVRIRMSEDGHFWARTQIDGVPRRMLIDSGATTTALSQTTARAAGIEARRSALQTVLTTANGDIMADVSTINELRLGDIGVHDLGVVVSPAFGETDVLGMNFLSRLVSWRVEGQTLILTPHHPKNFT